MSKRHWYKRYPADFIEGVVGLSLEEKGAYSIVLDLIYARGRPIPDDARYIAGVCGCSVRRWNAIKGALIAAGKIIVSDGHISNPRATSEIGSLEKYGDNPPEKRAKAGDNPEINSRKNQDKSAEKESESLEINGLETQNLAYARDIDTEADTEERDKSLSMANPPRAAKKGTAIPADWTFGEAERATAEKFGITGQRAEALFAHFHDHWTVSTGKTAVKKNWPTAWRMWCRNEVKYAAEREARQSRFPPKPPDKPCNRGGFATILLENMDELLRDFNDEQPPHRPDDDWRSEPEIIPPGGSDTRGFAAGGPDLFRDENRADGLSNVFDFRQARAYG